MASSSETLRLFQDSPKQKTPTISPNEPTNFFSKWPPRPSSDMEFITKCPFFGNTLRIKEFHYNFRGISWTFEFYKELRWTGLRIHCNKGNKSRLWKCTASICRQLICPTPLPTEDKYEEFTFDADKTHVEFPKIADFQCLMEFAFNIVIKNVTGYPLKPLLDFTNPRENVLDGCLIIGDRKVYVGKAFLAMFSPFFNSLFFSQFVERNMEEIPLTGDIDHDEFIQFLSFIYPNDKSIDFDNVESLLKYSDRFDVTFLMERCEKWLLSADSVDKAKKMLLAEQFHLSQLQNQVIQSLGSQKELQILSRSPAYEKLSDASKTALLNRMLEIMNDSGSSSSSSDESYGYREPESESDEPIRDFREDTSETGDENDLFQDIFRHENEMMDVFQQNESDDIIVVD